MTTEAVTPNTSYLGKRRFETSPLVEIPSRPTYDWSVREKARKTEDTAVSVLRSNFEAENVEFLESQLLSLKIEYQLNQERKDNERMQLELLIQSLRESNQKLHAEKCVASEENLLLKRAIQVLDRKHKDSISQITQLQDVLLKATEHIHELERQNKNLSYHLSLERGRQCWDEQPPDVF